MTSVRAEGAEVITKREAFNREDRKATLIIRSPLPCAFLCVLSGLPLRSSRLRALLIAALEAAAAPERLTLYCGTSISTFSTWTVLVLGSSVPVILIFRPANSRTASCLSRR